MVAPPSVTVKAEGLEAAGQEQGMSVYQKASINAGTLVAVSLSGTAPPPSDNAGDSGSQGQGGDAQGNSGASIQVVPGRLDALKWPLAIGFILVFGFGAYLLSRKQVVVTVAGSSGETLAQAAPVFTAAQQNTGASPPASMASLATAVGKSLDALKDQIFRLELRRQAGTITEEEYARERAKAEQVLRDLVRG